MSDALAYPVTFAGGFFNAYFFQTQQGVIYEVQFTPSGYLFPNLPFLDAEVFEFSITIADNQSGRNPTSDPRMPATIAEVFRQFFTSVQQVIVYICDSSDARQRVRYRKFNNWFTYYKAEAFLKIDRNFTDNGTTVYTSLIIHEQHPHIVEILAEYSRVTSGK
jgi:hypothetical protein